MATSYTAGFSELQSKYEALLNQHKADQQSLFALWRMRKLLVAQKQADKQVIGDLRARGKEMVVENNDLLIEVNRLCQLNLELKSKLETKHTELKREQALRWDDGQDILYTLFLEENWDGHGDAQASYEDYWKNEINILGDE